MNFNIIPYTLYTILNDELKSKLEYGDRNNDVDYYFVKQLPIIEIMGIKINQISLYFYEDYLIAVYIQLDEKSMNHERVLKVFEKGLKEPSEPLKVDIGTMYQWERGEEILGLLCEQEDSYLYLYYTLKEFNIFHGV